MNQGDPGGPDGTGPRLEDVRRYRDAFVGMAVLACTPFLIFGAVSLYGWWTVTGLGLAWVLLLFIGGASFTRAPRRVLVAGLLSWALWLLAVMIAR